MAHEKGTKRLAYMPLFTADFLGGVRFLTPSAIGVYIQLLCIEWENGPMPSDQSILASRVPGFADAWPSIACKFVVGPDGLMRNVRLEAERERVGKVSASLSERGSKGAKARWDASANASANGPSNATANAQAMARAYECEYESGSASGSDFPEGDARGRAEPGPLVPSSAARHVAATDRHAADVWASVPSDWRKSRTDCLPLIYDAVRSIASANGGDLDAAASHLSARIASYVASPEGSGHFRRSLKRWLSDEAHAEDDAAWQKPDEKPKPRQRMASW